MIQALNSVYSRTRRQSLKSHFRSLSKPFPNAPQSGMTIIEILIVIALIGTIMTIVISNLLGPAEQAKIDLTRVAQTNLKSSLVQYKLNTNQFPTTEAGLSALIVKPENAKGWRGPYVDDKDRLRDAWGEEMQYERLSANTYQITSAGPDTVMGNEDDVIYPEPKVEEIQKPVSAEFTIPPGQSAE